MGDGMVLASGQLGAHLSASQTKERHYAMPQFYSPDDSVRTSDVFRLHGYTD
jgi:hypothetical protein